MIKNFKGWLNEESRSGPSMTALSIERRLIDLGLEPKTSLSSHATYVRSELPADQESLSVDLQQEVLGLVENPPSELLSVDASLGYQYGNQITFTLVGSATHRLNRAYHVTQGRNLEGILENGLLPSTARESSEFFKPRLGKGSFNYMVYSAVFLVPTRSDAKKVAKFFNIQDPHVIEIDARGLDLYEDPFLSSRWHKPSNFPSRSYLSLEEIPVYRIRSHSAMSY